MSAVFDLIVIGGGPGGYTAAIRGAQHGMTVALVEERLLGGVCLNRGCIPTKAIMHASHLFREMKECGVFGLSCEALGYDMGLIQARKDAVVSQLREGVAQLMEANGISVYQGRGLVTDPGTVRVTGESYEEIRGSNILIAVGAVPVTPPIPGAKLPGVFTSDGLLEGTPRDYKSLVIIGGGVIGTEAATIYNNLGCAVTILEGAERILPIMDREISQNLSMILKKRGVEIHTGSTVEEITQTDGGLTVRFSGKKGQATVTGEGVLLSIGRRPNLEGLFAESCPLPEMDRGIVVNERFETSVPGIYAIGDCRAGSMQLAHTAAAEATCAVACMAGEGPEMNLTVIPGCIYTEPEIASVGLSADDAKKKGIPVKTSKFIMSGNGKTLIEGQERGFIKLVFDAETEVLLGAQLMCGRATDLLGELATAIVTGRSASELASVIRPHPTFSEGVSESVEDLFGRAVHVMPKRKPKS